MRGYSHSSISGLKWVQVSSFIALIHLGKATPDLEWDTDTQQFNNCPSWVWTGAEAQGTTSTKKKSRENQAEIHFGHWTWTRHRWLHSYLLLNNALTQTQGWKGGESAPDPFRELDDCSRESQQSLLGNSELRTCESSKPTTEQMLKRKRKRWENGWGQSEI